MLVSKEFKFEMGHKLYKSYTKKCMNLHGHSYKASVSFAAKSLNDEAVVIDFTQIKEVLEPFIKKLDHSFMISKYDELTPFLLKEAESGKTRLIVTPVNPTAEYIAGLILKQVRQAFIGKFDYLEVSVKETDTSLAVASSKDELVFVDPEFFGYGAPVNRKPLLAPHILSRITSLQKELGGFSIKKFEKHSAKGDWRETKTLRHSLAALVHECAELCDALDILDKPDMPALRKREVVANELGDIFNYLIILLDLIDLKLKGGIK